MPCVLIFTTCKRKMVIFSAHTTGSSVCRPARTQLSFGAGYRVSRDYSIYAAVLTDPCGSPVPAFLPHPPNLLAAPQELMMLLITVRPTR
jgi:hypothetical protein